MNGLRHCLRRGFFGILLAYAMAVQAMLSGPLLAGPLQNTAQELCLPGEDMPAGGPHHGGKECPCLVPGAGHVSAFMPVPHAIALPMRNAVPFAYSAPFLPSGEGQGPESPAARGPPSFLV